MGDIAKTRASMADNWTRFWIVTSASGKLQASSFDIRRDLQLVCGPPKHVKRLRSGDLLIEVSSKEQSEKLSRLYNIGSNAVKAEPHRSLNSSKCVITNREFAYCSTEDLVEEFRSIGVISARKLGTRGTVLLTFGKPSYPPEIKFFYQRIRTREYLPNPLRCYKCNRFGHTSKACRSEETCQLCSRLGHPRDQCKNEKLCINCNGAHDAGSRECPKFILEKRVIELKFREKIPFAEARKRASKPLYSEAVKTPKKFADAATQTLPEVIEIADASETDQPFPRQSSKPVPIPQTHRQTAPTTSSRTKKPTEAAAQRKRKTSTEAPSSSSNNKRPSGSSASSQRPKSVVTPPFKHQRR